MLIILIGLVIGCVVGVLLPVNIPGAYTIYIAVALLAALDSVLGGLNAEMRGKFNFAIFASGFFGNALIAVAMVYFGNKIGLELYLAAIVVFGTRLFQNFAEIRRQLLTKPKNRGMIEEIGLQNSEEKTEDK